MGGEHLKSPQCLDINRCGWTCTYKRKVWVEQHCRVLLQLLLLTPAMQHRMEKMQIMQGCHERQALTLLHSPQLALLV